MREASDGVSKTSAGFVYPCVIYHGTNKVLKSVSRGDGWVEVSPDLTTNDQSKMPTGKGGDGNIQYCTIIALDESLIVRDLLWAGTDDGNVWVTKDGGKNWTKLNDKINAAAADRILLEISRRSIGGRNAVDFLPPSTSASRIQLAEHLRSGLRSIQGARFGRLAPDGVCDLTAPRRSLSLLESATETAGADWPVQGRRFTLDWSAKAAIRALEAALVARPSSSPRLIVPEETGNYLRRTVRSGKIVSPRDTARDSA